MKCVLLKTGDVVRVTDEVAEQLVKRGGRYVQKSAFKKQREINQRG